MSMRGITLAIMEKTPILFSEAKKLLVRQVIALECEEDEPYLDGELSVTALASLCRACSIKPNYVSGEEMELLYLSTYDKTYKKEIGGDLDGDPSLPECMSMKVEFPKSAVVEIAALVATRDAISAKEWHAYCKLQEKLS